MANSDDIFNSGSQWLKVDFHLHTRRDKEFRYSGKDNWFISNYVQGLHDANIKIGIITNHNKFDLDEFKALDKCARKKQIFLLPGVELSVTDGSNGIHILIVFGDKWLTKGQDYINPFLSAVFEGKTANEYENENERTQLVGLLEIIKKLENNHKDFFIVCAHVEEKNGLWHELEGGRIGEIGKDKRFGRRVLGFQKVRSHDKANGKCRKKIKYWLKERYPAELEGSDCKSIEDIGKSGKECYLKIGNFSFEAVKYALVDHKNRVALKPSRHIGSYIKSISFDGGKLDRKTINFAQNLNTLIGIRGSGKSSIIETIRYVLDVDFGDKALDKEYKISAVDRVLESGGKATIKAVNRHGCEYEIRRINNEAPNVYINGKIQVGVSIKETIINKPVYFGQKDLSATDSGFEKDMVEKLVSGRLVEVRNRIKNQRQHIIEIVRQLSVLSNVEEQKEEYTFKKLDAEHKLEIYKQYAIEEKLQEQLNFDVDLNYINNVTNISRNHIGALTEFMNDSNSIEIFSIFPGYASKNNQIFIDDFFKTYIKLMGNFNAMRDILINNEQLLADMVGKQSKLLKRRDSLKENFAKVEREISASLKDSGIETIRPDEFRILHNTVLDANEKLKSLDNKERERRNKKASLLDNIQKLNDLWLEEFNLVKNELSRINDQGGKAALQIKSEYKGDKVAFKKHMIENFRGSSLRDTTYQKLAEHYVDFNAIYRDFDNVENILGKSFHIFQEYFLKAYENLLTWQVPNQFTIEYRGKKLKDHSLGQRASALILFVLNQRENDLLIIDQPEDDLDNQTIYDDVIKLICTLRSKKQFIFATHNANFPVLGDAEQVMICTYSDNSMAIKSGSIDNPILQQGIVDIMEGGQEAFERRKTRYGIWAENNV